MYAQKVEGESWVGDKIEPGKMEKMSGMFSFLPLNIREGGC